MQIFFEMVLQLSGFAVNILLPLSLAFLVVGSAVANKSILKAAFSSAIAVIVLYVVIFSIQLYQVASSGTPVMEIFKNTDSLLALAFTFLLPVVIGAVVAVRSNRRFKRIA